MAFTAFVRMGWGTFYLAALANDLGRTGTVPPGSLGPSAADLRLLTCLVVAPAEYVPTAALHLNHVVPFASDPVIPPSSCADLGALKRAPR